MRGFIFTVTALALTVITLGMLASAFVEASETYLNSMKGKASEQLLGE